MRIAYLTDINITIETGVQKKMKMQLEMWKSLGNEAKFFSIPSEMNDDVPLVNSDYVHFFDHPISRTPFKGLNVYLRRIFTVNAVRRELKRYKPDIVYVREMLWFPGITRILSLFPVIWESNTLLLNELKAIAHPLVYTANKWMLPSVYKKLDGVIGVTEEITKTYEKYTTQCAVIANGITVRKTHLPPPPRKNNRPKIIFVGSPGMKWHGTEHFFQMAELTPQADFYIVGPTVNNTNTTSLPNLTQYGYMKNQDLQQLYPKMDIAVGSLALYVNNMHEACPLKVREYFLYGFPLILAYKDTDFSGTPFVLEIGNHKNGVKDSIKDIHEFIESWKGKRINIQEYASLVDTELKEKKRLDVFRKVLTSKNVSYEKSNHS